MSRFGDLPAVPRQRSHNRLILWLGRVADSAASAAMAARDCVDSAETAPAVRGEPDLRGMSEDAFVASLAIRTCSFAALFCRLRFRNRRAPEGLQSRMARGIGGRRVA
jgi:hypothetical protein